MVVISDKYLDEIDDRDAPPSYDTIAPNTSPRTRPTDDKSQGPSASASTSSSSITPARQQLNKLPGKQKGTTSSWLSLLPFTSSRTSKQVRQTVLSLVRDLVVSPTPSASSDILDSCADACAANQLDLSTLLQEPSIEDHTPMYWAIVNRRDEGEVLASLLLHTRTAPLSAATLSDIRLACLVTSNQKLFHALRTHRAPFDALQNQSSVSSRSGTDALVLGSTIADDVHVREVDGDGAFVATFDISMWQKRMRVAGRVGVEFIARGRIWSVTFFSAPASAPSIAGKTVGTWQVALSLLDHSPATHIDSRLVIDAPSRSEPEPSSSSVDLPAATPTSPPSPSRPPGTYPPPPRRSSFGPKFPSTSKSKSKSSLPPIEVRLKSNSNFRLAYRSSPLFLAAFTGKDEGAPPRVDHWAEEGVGYTNALVVPLGEGAGAGLMYDDTPYISPDGTLHARLEARLVKPDSTDCIIC
ncbi:hypothetical protein BV22DRAFT_1022361 [Leucogyrophana mollusca]|uniref:Uncharacterized protein n=1 Tax=Leucogyrophana mollusca TaxID=85980 RepID=A0ACB8B4L0_9AGAM|nr:hypothetical protein BV22DRAFT_1022361 [Leucogyrophana mollusca]